MVERQAREMWATINDLQARLNASALEFTNPPLDAGIKRAVEILIKAGIETYESCEGGKGHAYTEPTVRFYGERAEGYRALAVALDHALPVRAIKRIWTIQDGEATGPTWEMVFWRKLK